MSLSPSVLGVFRASLNGHPVTEFYSSTARALLAYLAIEAERQHPRPTLAMLLWPEWGGGAFLAGTLTVSSFATQPRVGITGRLLGLVVAISAFEVGFEDDALAHWYFTQF